MEFKKNTTREWAPCSETLGTGALKDLAKVEAKKFNSSLQMKAYRTKHTRTESHPMAAFHEPVTSSMDIGWHATEGGVFSNKTTPRTFHPRITCPMTLHNEAMYCTDSKHIIRKW